MKLHTLHRHLVIATWLALASVVNCRVVGADEAEPAAAAKPQAVGEAAPETGPSNEQIAAWIVELDSNRYRVRERATQELLAAGPAALDALLTAANGHRPEPADRALWILRKLTQAEDRLVAFAALDRLVLVKDRPAIVLEALQTRTRLRELACQEILARLGGRLTIVEQVTPEFGQIRLVYVVLDDNWRGTAKDFQCLAWLDRHRFFRLEGPGVGDAEVKLFASMDSLLYLQLFKTRVTYDAVDAIKERQPKATVYVRNRAQLGIGGATHEQGVLVDLLQASGGAEAAGIVIGDVIASMDGKPIKDFDRLTAEIAQHEPGDQLDVTILRGNEELTKRVTLGAWQDNP